MDVVMVGDGVVVVLVQCFISLFFNLIDLGFVDLFVLFDFSRFGMWFLSFGFFIYLYVLWVDFSWAWVLVFVFFKFRFWFLYVLFVVVLQTRNYPTAPTSSTNNPDIQLVVGPFSFHPIQLGWVMFNQKPNPTRLMDNPKQGIRKMKSWKRHEKLYMQITEVNVIVIAKIMMWYKSKNSSYQYLK